MRKLAFIFAAILCLAFDAHAQAFYGSKWAADQLANTTIGPNIQGDYRFRASTSSTLTSIHTFWITGTGYSAGTGGSFRIDVETDDGTSNHFPSGTVLATKTATSPATEFVTDTFATPAALTAGTLYHIVYTNIDASPTVNFTSLDMIQITANLSPAQPTISEIDWAHLYNSGTVASPTWVWRHSVSDGDFMPTLQLDSGDGTIQCNGYMEVWINTSRETVSGANEARETFTVSGGNKTVYSFSVRMEKASGTDPLTVSLQTGAGAVIESGTIPAASFSSTDAWVTYSFTSPHVLTSGSAYNIILTAPSTSSYSLYPIRKGITHNFDAPTYFADGNAQLSSNSGSTWTNWPDESAVASTEGDLQFYFATQLWSGILDSYRAIDWTTAGLNGTGVVPGARSTICVTAACATATTAGTAATTAQINAALASCPSGDVVLLASGTYSVTATYQVPSNCTLRGAGPQTGGTVLNSTVASGAIVEMGTGGVPYAMSGAKVVTGGAIAGSTAITVGSADIGSFSAGQYMDLDQLDTGNVVSTGNGGLCSPCSDIGQGGIRSQGIMLEITNVNAGTDTITFNPPLPIGFSNSPQAVAFSVAKYAGLEMVQIYSNNTGSNPVVQFNGCAYCWEWRYEHNYADGANIYLSSAFRSQVTEGYLSNAFQHTPGTDPTIELMYRSWGNLIEDNICERLHACIMVESGASGNAIDYNYDAGGFDTGSENAIFDGVGFHGANPMFNDSEGNTTCGYGPDNTWGSAGPNTFFRNWSMGTCKVCLPIVSTRSAVNCSPAGYPQQSGANSWYQFQAAIAVNFTNQMWNPNQIGNVVGSSYQSALVDTSDVALTGIDRAWGICAGAGGTPCGSGARPYGTKFYPYTFGFGNTSDTGAGILDSQTPLSTLLLHGDYDYNTNAITWAPNVTHTLRASFIYSAKPSWFGSAPWPITGPDVTGGLPAAGGHANKNPAQICYEAMGGDGGTNSPLNFNPATCYGGTTPPPSAPNPPSNASVVFIAKGK